MTTEAYEKNDRNFLLFGGIISLVLGFLLLTQPTASLAVVMLMIGLVWFVQGLFTILSIFADKSQWGWKLFGGIIGITAGLLVFQYPVASTAAIPAVIAILLGLFGLMIGISALIGAFQGDGWGAGFFGVISIIIGLLLIFNSVVGGQALVWIVAALLVIQGIVGIFWSFRSS